MQDVIQGSKFRQAINGNHLETLPVFHGCHVAEFHLQQVRRMHTLARQCTAIPHHGWCLQSAHLAMPGDGE